MLDYQNIGGVYFCQEFDFQDPSSCQYQIAALKTCVNLGPDFDNQISSFGPDDCTVCHGELSAMYYRYAVSDSGLFVYSL